MRNFQTYSNDVSSISLHNRLLYSSGIVSHALKEAAMGVFILFYYKQVLGLSGTLTGLAIAISIIWDGISDPTDWRLVRPFALAHWSPPPANDCRCYSNGCGFCHAVRATGHRAERPRAAVCLAADQHPAGAHSPDLFYGALPSPGRRDYQRLSRALTAGWDAHQYGLVYRHSCSRPPR